MAFENIVPYRDLILSLREPGKNRQSLTQIVDTLRELHKVETSIGTLSRYLKHVAPEKAVRDPTRGEHETIDTLALHIEILAEIAGSKQEVRGVIEKQDGQLRNLSLAIDELREEVAKRPTSAASTAVSGEDSSIVANNSTAQPDRLDQAAPVPLRKIWKRAFLITFFFKSGSHRWHRNLVVKSPLELRNIVSVMRYFIQRFTIQITHSDIASMLTGPFLLLRCAIQLAQFKIAPHSTTDFIKRLTEPALLDNACTNVIDRASHALGHNLSPEGGAQFAQRFLHRTLQPKLICHAILRHNQ